MPIRHETLGRCGVALILLAFGLVLHWPVGAGFKADDYPAISYASDLGRVLSDWVGPQYDLRCVLFYRPVIVSSLAVDHALFGIEPFGFLLMNALACIVSGLLIQAIAVQMFPGARGRLFGFLLAVLWLAQPILLLSVRWVVGRVDTHFGLVMLASTWFFLLARRGRLIWPAWVLAVAALGTKETAIGLPLILLGLDLLHPVAAVRGPILRGRRLPSLPFLILLPAFALFRKLVLGEYVGGYGQGQSLELSSKLEGLWLTLSRGFAPVPSAWLSTVLALVPLLFVCYWLCRHDARGRRITGVLCVSAGLFGPLLPILEWMVDPLKHRIAYLACVWMLTGWLGCVFFVVDGSRRRSAGAAAGSRELQTGIALLILIGLLPLSWILPAWVESRRLAIAEYTNQVRTLEALEEGDRQTADRSDPLILAQAAPMLFQGFWGLGAVMKPPFREEPREIVTLRHFSMPWIEAVDESFLDSAVSGTVQVIDDRPAWVVTPDSHRPVLVEARGFDGVLRTRDLTTLAQVYSTRRFSEAATYGYEAGPEYDGRVAMVTSIGSVLLALPAVDGRLRLADLLTASAVPEQSSGSGLAAPELIWKAVDLAKDSPIYLYWHASDGLRRAELRAGPHLADAIWRLLIASR